MQEESPAAEPIRYENFDLSIEKGRRRGYRVRLLQSPSGEGWAGFRPPFTTDELDRFLASHDSAYRDIQATGKSPPKSLEEIGRKLFKSLFAGRIRSLWEASLKDKRPLRIRLHLGSVPEFEAWPWELLYDPDRRIFLSASRLTPVVRYLNVGASAPPLEVDPPVRVLVVAASPAGRSPLDLEREWGKLEAAVAPLKSGGRLILDRVDPPTPAALQQKLRQPYHILHFIGHGAFSSELGAVELESEDRQPLSLSGEALAAILAHQADLRLVILNSCDGARISRNDPFSGAAQALVACGLPAVIAMRSRISDRAAIDWIGSFYEALVSNDPVDAALSGARWAVKMRDDGIDWTIPVLYMRSPDGCIFRVTPATPAREVRIPPAPQPPDKGETVRRRIILGILLIATLLGPGLWVLSRLQPSLFVTSDPGCPSPPGLHMPFALVPPGTVLIDSERKGPARKVRIGRAFCIGKFEVTQRQWRTLMLKNPSRRKGGNLPVEGVSWFEAQQFVDKLNEIDPKGHYRIADEPEWLRAAETGGEGHDPEQMSRFGNCDRGDGYEKTAPVGSFEPNALGIYDLYGNVSEWVNDWYEPRGGGPSNERVRRGGSFQNSPENCAAALRSHSKPDRNSEDTGFRVVRDPVRLGQTTCRSDVGLLSETWSSGATTRIAISCRGMTTPVRSLGGETLCRIAIR